MAINVCFVVQAKQAMPCLELFAKRVFSWISTFKWRRREKINSSEDRSPFLVKFATAWLVSSARDFANFIPLWPLRHPPPPCTHAFQLPTLRAVSRNTSQCSWKERQVPHASSLIAETQTLLKCRFVARPAGWLVGWRSAVLGIWRRTPAM